MIETKAAPTRRGFLAAAGAAVAVVAVVRPVPAPATPAQVAAEIKRLVSGRTPIEGRIALDLPPVAENGLTVPLGFEVESPMTETDHVKALHLLAEGNPLPTICHYYFTPLAPKAAAQIRIRLAQTQFVVAVAEMSDGRVFTARREVTVTVGGCSE